MVGQIPSGCKTILVAPLDWGLGHATRCIPIIRELSDKNIEVIIAGDGESLTLLQKEFPMLTTETLPSYGVKYNGTTLLSILVQNGPRVLTAMMREKKKAQALCKKYKPQLIISDSRFGFRCKGVHSIIISHQLNVQCQNKGLKLVLDVLNTRILNAFDSCWVPDDSDRALTGVLTFNPKVKNQQYIGPLSRLKKMMPDDENIYETTLILSGPEPARTRLEKRLLNHFTPTNRKICLIRGTERLPSLDLPPNWTVFNLASSQEINNILVGSKEIISRSGYTSIMDYAHLGVGAKLVPTPGQTEQMYLAEYLNGKMGFSKWE